MTHRPDVYLVEGLMSTEPLDKDDLALEVDCDNQSKGGRPRAKLVRDCLARYLRERELVRLRQELAAEVAEEALPLGNEALEIAERNRRRTG